MSRQSVNCHAASSRFMQLNPARGRKLLAGLRKILNIIQVYAAQPREGTETMSLPFFVLRWI